MESSRPPQSPMQPADEHSRKPTIRTMKTDMEEYVKSGKPTILQMIGTDAQGRFRPEKKNFFSSHVLTGILVLLILAVTGGGAYVAFLRVFPPPSGNQPVRLTPPAPYFATETSRTISIPVKDRSLFLRLMEDALGEREREGTIKRLLIKIEDGGKERFATMEDIFSFYRIDVPLGVLAETEDPLMTFIYYGRDGVRFGVAARTKDENRLLRDLLSWEPGMLQALDPFFFREAPEPIVAPFEDRTYRNIDWRLLKLSSNEDLGIAHTIFPGGNIFVLTTSKEGMETVINRLFDAR